MPSPSAHIYWFVFYEDLILLDQDHNIPCAAQAPCVLTMQDVCIPVVDYQQTPCRAISLAECRTPQGYEFVSLRSSFELLPRALYALAGKARELLYWDANNQYCGKCGSPLVFHTPISKHCPNCGRTVWPQLSIAIIVAVTRGPEILLVQSNQFKSDYMGLVAGFVETGETLEECVHREVMEETHVQIRNLRYFQSQPWPYPCGLMVGFKAEYASGELQLQRSELNKGGWFRPDNLPQIPGKVSLARRLIDDWLSHQ